MICKYTCMEIRRNGHTYSVVLAKYFDKHPMHFLILDGLTEEVLDTFRVGDIYKAEIQSVVKLP